MKQSKDQETKRRICGRRPTRFGHRAYVHLPSARCACVAFRVKSVTSPRHRHAGEFARVPPIYRLRNKHKQEELKDALLQNLEHATTSLGPCEWYARPHGESALRTRMHRQCRDLTPRPQPRCRYCILVWTSLRGEVTLTKRIHVYPAVQALGGSSA